MGPSITPDERRIYSIRGQRIMLDSDLAEIYGVGTRVLNQAVRRNHHRFPANFMFELIGTEIRNISQIVICSGASSGFKHSKKEIEGRVHTHDDEIRDLFIALGALIQELPERTKRIGFQP